ncbi:MAG: DUF58 domain-containing protein [Gammaproteobacteria bacterium]|nr:DUF58 domain-containing protein [Gammaproteobacteria bacterium]NIR82415.1 DUF58 domain-containing protein [Gammaproteobacteria bacterium]NIR91996.1 DUF58 domain-containing protein [Gammaproteobacteria bacterium]NIU03552.1 DUF58 domain-containing protein [Gammaproteobacteria bacterium]NIX84826.1 DUF58 domain-containing protein [Gammaproteobacteria bacterium]
MSTPASAAPGRTAPARFIDPQVLARIDNLDLIARVVVDGFISGLHKTVHLGVSTDFAEHRAYAPGDDVRHVDWRVFARTDRLYVKTYEAQTNADLSIALDVSASMGYGSGEVTKLDYARFIAAALAHLASRQRDRVGLATLDADVVEYVAPSGRRRDTVLQALDRARAAGRGDLARALARLGERLARRGILVVVSDFYAPPQAAAVALDALRVRGHDVIALHVLDPLERDLDLPGPAVLEDLETGERLPVTPQGRAQYRALVDAHVAALARACGDRRIDYECFVTDRPLDDMLWRYLSNRARLARVR